VILREINSSQLKKLGLDRILSELKFFWSMDYIGKNLSPPRNYCNTRNYAFTFTCGEIQSPNIKVFGFRSYIMSVNGKREADLYIIYDSEDPTKSYLFKSNDIRVWRCAAITLLFLQLSGFRFNNLNIVGCGKINSFIAIYLIEKNPFICINLFSKTQNSKEILNKRLAAIKKPAMKEFEEGRNLYLVATNSQTPVLSYSQLPKKWVIVHIGPKYKNNNDIDLEIYKKADLIVTDSLQQMISLKEKLIFKVTNKIFDLADFLNGGKIIEFKHERIIFSSVGMSATELLICSLIIKNRIYE